MASLGVVALALGIGFGAAGAIGIFVEPRSDVPPRFLLAGLAVGGIGWLLT